MKLTISTESFKNELMDWVNIHGYASGAKTVADEPSGCSLIIEAGEKISENLADLFENIILEKNQVAKYRTRLKKLLKGIVFEPRQHEIVRSLDDYMRENNHVNLEGYITFRMSKYTGAVNLVLYAAMKKLLY